MNIMLDYEQWKNIAELFDQIAEPGKGLILNSKNGDFDREFCTAHICTNEKKLREKGL